MSHNLWHGSNFNHPGENKERLNGAEDFFFFFYDHVSTCELFSEIQLSTSRRALKLPLKPHFSDPYISLILYQLGKNLLCPSLAALHKIKFLDFSLSPRSRSRT